MFLSAHRDEAEHRTAEHRVLDLAGEDDLSPALSLPALESGESSSPALSSPEQPRVRDMERFSGHRIKLQLFEGPLDLLLYLVRAHRYDICDIPINQVTTQFVEFLSLMEELDLEYAGDFLVTAASLMAIKSRMLLPRHQSQNEDEIEDDSDDDPRKQLVERLLEYQRFQDAAEQLRGLRDERASLYARPPIAPDVSALIEEISNPTDDDYERTRRETGALLGEISTFDLLRALQKVLDRQAEAPVATIRREPFSLPERVRDITRRLSSTRSGVSFADLCDDCQSRLEIVITFLAVLELIRRFQASIEQLSLFDEIWVKKK